jgi:hypothetical protein
MRGPRRTFIVGETLNAPLPDVIHTSEPRYAELKEQAIERKRSEMEDYLLHLAAKLPPGSTVHVQAHVSQSAAKLIIEHAQEEQADVIVGHPRGGISQLLFGSTTERSCAPAWPVQWCTPRSGSADQRPVGKNCRRRREDNEGPCIRAIRARQPVRDAARHDDDVAGVQRGRLIMAWDRALEDVDDLLIVG